MGVKTLDRLAILAAMLLVAGLSVILIHRYQVSRIKQSLLVRAAQAEKDGSFGQASESYQEYLCLAPDDQDVRLKFAGVLLKGPKSFARQEWAAYIFEQSLMALPLARRRPPASGGAQVRDGSLRSGSPAPTDSLEIRERGWRPLLLAGSVPGRNERTSLCPGVIRYRHPAWHLPPARSESPASSTSWSLARRIVGVGRMRDLLPPVA